jgi:hypothetical protein
MRKTYKRFEQVPVAVVEKILEQQGSLTKPGGNLKLVVKKLGKGPSTPDAQPRKVEVLVP